MAQHSAVGVYGNLGDATAAVASLEGGGFPIALLGGVDEGPGGALTGWPLRVTGPLALPACLVGLDCLPADGARMGLLPQGMPGLSCALLIGSPTPGTVDQTRAALGKSASITRILQDTQGQSTR